MNKEKAAQIFSVFSESVKAFYRNDDFKTSAALAYYGLFALIPIFLLVLYPLGHYTLSSQDAIKGLERLSAELLPEFHKVIFKEVHSLSHHRGMWGAASIIALFWAVIPLVSAVRDAFFTIFRVENRHPFFKERLLDAAAVMVLLVLFISLVISEIIYTQFVTMFLKDLPVLLKISNFVAPLLITMFFMVIFYLVFSPARPKFKHLLAGSAVTAVLWIVMRPAFTIFLTFNKQFGFALGSLKAILVILVWVYYSFSVILFGAEVISSMTRRSGYKP